MREKPIPNINVEETTARKRAANTLAARRCRKRKIRRVQELEDEVAKLKEERDHWKRVALEGMRTIIAD